MKRTLLRIIRILTLLLVSLMLTLCTATAAAYPEAVHAGTDSQYPIEVRIGPEQIVDISKLPGYEIPEYRIPLSKELQDYTYALCSENKLSYELILALIKIESGFRVNLVSRNSNRTKDNGLAQINNRYQAYHSQLLGIENFDPMNPRKSIEMCVKLLNYYQDIWSKKGIKNEVKLQSAMLLSYNRGLKQAQAYISKNGYSDRYVNAVLTQKNYLEEHARFKD